MRINTANCFLLAGSALLIIGRQNRGFITRMLFDVISIGILLISGMTIYEYASGMDLGIDQLVLNYLPQSQGSTFSGRMAFITAINFNLLAFTFILSSRKSISVWIIQTCAFVVMLLALFSLFNYLYSYNNNFYIRYTSLQAALLFIMTSIGVVLVSPESYIWYLQRKITIADIYFYGGRYHLPLFWQWYYFYWNYF